MATLKLQYRQVMLRKLHSVNLQTVVGKIN